MYPDEQQSSSKKHHHTGCLLWDPPHHITTQPRQPPNSAIGMQPTRPRVGRPPTGLWGGRLGRTTHRAQPRACHAPFPFLSGRVVRPIGFTSSSLARRRRGRVSEHDGPKPHALTDQLRLMVLPPSPANRKLLSLWQLHWALKQPAGASHRPGWGRNRCVRRSQCDAQSSL